MKLLLLFALALPAQDAEVRRILDRAAEAKPTEAELAFYSLDWAPSLKEAKARAAKEGRPVFFVWVTNISGADRFFTGHC
jgi:hypothetical protein